MVVIQEVSKNSTPSSMHEEVLDPSNGQCMAALEERLRGGKGERLFQKIPCFN
jgi:hypothetical protein